MSDDEGRTVYGAEWDRMTAKQRALALMVADEREKAMAILRDLGRVHMGWDHEGADAVVALARAERLVAESWFDADAGYAVDLCDHYVQTREEAQREAAARSGQEAEWESHLYHAQYALHCVFDVVWCATWVPEDRRASTTVISKCAEEIGELIKAWRNHLETLFPGSLAATVDADSDYKRLLNSGFIVRRAYFEDEWENEMRARASADGLRVRARLDFHARRPVTIIDLLPVGSSLSPVWSQDDPSGSARSWRTIRETVEADWGETLEAARARCS
jgi:hypothetical protein